MSTILVVAAHPDDEVLGCGGAMARWVAEGHAIHICILGEGVTSRYDSRAEGQADGAETLIQVHDHVERAAAVLGAASSRVLGLPDNRFDSLDLLDVIKQVEAVKQDLQPDCVLTHHLGDLNVDHRVTHQAVMTAFRPQPGERCREILAFEVNSSTEYQVPSPTTAFLPTRYVVVDELALEKKIEAMAVYETELREWPHPRSLEALRVLASWRGSQVGHALAEAFVCCRMID